MKLTLASSARRFSILAQCVMTPLRDEMGSLRGFSKIMQDITARTKAEKERNQLLRRDQAARLEAEAANRSTNSNLENDDFGSL
ncbi:hypothetical protein ACQ4M3_06160 [Leptolyngbya sp. AN03gr2]|uniref:hypothetical protein n=1 Tax=unclassified Leptolyngbya TaxID=2650499 RepID=UPI003D319C42